MLCDPPSFRDHANRILHSNRFCRSEVSRLAPDRHTVLHAVASSLLASGIFLISIRYFSVFALKELEPGVAARPVRLAASAPAGPGREPAPGAAPQVRSARLLSHVLPPHAFLCSTELWAGESSLSRRRSRSLGDGFEQPLFSCYRELSISGSSSRRSRRSWKPCRGERACLATTPRR